MPSQRKSEKTHLPTPDPELNNLVEEILLLQQLEKERQAFSQRVGRTGTFNWDIKTGESTWTQEFEALYGFPQGGFGSGSFDAWIQCVHPDDRQRVTEETEIALKGKDELNMEFRVVWPDKSIHHLITRARIVRDAKGKPIEMSGVNIDITERKQLEISLHYLSEASKTLASSLDYHETLKTITRLAVPEIADWCAIDMFTDNHEAKRLEIAHIDPKKVKWAWELNKKTPPNLDEPGGLAEVYRTGKSIFYPIVTNEMIEAAAKDKKHLELMKKINFHSVMIVPLNVEGKTTGAITFVITDSLRHFTQADLTVAEEVADRAAVAIHNARLFTDAQNAISVRDEFISVASHELKTPVTSLKMYNQIVLKQLEKRGDQTLLGPLLKMNTQIDKLTLLINDLLNISKIQLGKLEFNEEAFDLEQLVKDTVESIQSSTPTHTIKIEGHVKKSVWGDRDRISQVITNLLTNAIKYSPQANKVKVKISEQHGRAEVVVQDFGIGIDKEHQKKIFNRFYRATGIEEKTYPGLGIGLYISSEIIKRHHGKLVVHSTKGKGSEFCFTLPYKAPKKALTS